jgi:universal stress protein A
MTTFKKILLPTDFSDGVEAPLRLAAGLAKDSGGTVVLMHAYQTPILPLPEGQLIVSPEQMARLHKHLADELDKNKTHLIELGAPKVETIVVEGNPTDAVVRAAKEHGADLIVMSTHGRTGLSHLLIGSVTERVVRTASCPVLTVRPVAPG